LGKNRQIVTFLLKAFHNLGIWLTKLHLMQESSLQSTVLGSCTRGLQRARQSIWQHALCRWWRFSVYFIKL